MPLTTVQFAWAIPVDIVRFGAHLEAYTNLRPTLQILHLCKRSAKQKLPVDVLDMIEAYLADDERAKCRNEWEVPFKCWEARCEQADHFDAELEEKVDADPDGDAILPYMPKPWKYYEELVLYLPEETRGLRRRIRTYQEECKSKHHENVKIWRSKIARLQNSESREERDPMVNVLRTDFGLILWCPHSRWKGDEQEERDARRPPGFLAYSEAMFANMCATTIAYLRVPESVSVPHRHDPVPAVPAKRRQHNSEDVMIGWARSIEMPKTPSARSLERFARAIHILDCQPSGERAANAMKCLSQPELTMFTIVIY